MKITPLEIRQKTFEKAFRGLDKEEVMAFLTTLSSEWEKLMDENKELKIKLESSEREVEKLREVENSLFKTLKTAEDTGASMIDQATKAAQLHVKESEMKAEALLSEAKSKAKDMMEEAEMKSRNAIDEMEDRLRAMGQLYRTLENAREDLVSDIKTFANEAIEKANRVKSQVKVVNIDEEILKIKRESKLSDIKLEINFDAPKTIKKEETAPLKQVVKDQEANDSEDKPIENSPPAKKEKISSDDDTSFFDDLD